MRQPLGRLGAAAVSLLALVLTGVVVGGPVIEGPGTEGPVVGGPVALVDPEPTVHLAAAGDFAATANTRAVLDRMAVADPDLVLALGDLSYGTTGQEQAWCDVVTQSLGGGFPFELVAGNHESNGQNGNINDFAACLPNQLPGLVGTYARQSYVDVPALDPLVRIVTLSPALTFPDGNYAYPAGSPRYQWAAAAIDGARAESIPWVVVAMHKPCLSLGEYTCDMGPDLMNLLVSKKVDLVLNGHEHLYQRTAQLGLGPGCPAVVPAAVDTDCIVDADSTLVRGAGTVFATVGTGGQAQRPVYTGDVEAPYFVASSGVATATWGFLDVQATASNLTAQFVRASGGTSGDAFTIGPPAAGNVPPTAAFTSTCTQLDCTVDATSSTDADGTITQVAWSFGDGATGSGVTASHRYAAAGTYPVTLTVTDDGGATATTTRSVTVTAPPSQAFVADAFGRTLAGGWGTADAGGAWRLSGNQASYSVSGGSGAARFATPGVTLDASLPGTTAPSTDLTFTVQSDKAATGGGIYVAAAARRVAGVGEYRGNVRLRANGVVALGLSRTAGTAETTLIAPLVIQGLTLAPGEQLRVRVQAAGSAPTVLRARVWKVGTTEPTTWQVSTTDATAALQAPGAVGFNVYLSSSATNAPVVLRLDDVAGQAP